MPVYVEIHISTANNTVGWLFSYVPIFNAAFDTHSFGNLRLNLGKWTKHIYNWYAPQRYDDNQATVVKFAKPFVVFVLIMRSVSIVLQQTPESTSSLARTAQENLFISSKSVRIDSKFCLGANVVPFVYYTISCTRSASPLFGAWLQSVAVEKVVQMSVRKCLSHVTQYMPRVLDCV